MKKVTTTITMDGDTARFWTSEPEQLERLDALCKTSNLISCVTRPGKGLGKSYLMPRKWISVYVPIDELGHKQD